MNAAPEGGEGRCRRPASGGAVSRREWLKGIAAAGASASLSGCAGLGEGPGRPIQSSDRIRRENEKEGTRDWMLQKVRIDPETQYRCPWVEGYCSQSSVRPGERLAFHVSTNPGSRFTLDLYRMGYYQGRGGRHMMSLGPFEGRPQADPPVGENRLRECRWEPAAEIVIPEDWVSGVYIGKLTAEREGLQSYVIFIVRDDRWADFIFQCSDTTWQAYNRWPSQFSLYDDGDAVWYWGPGVRVGFDRPYGKYCQIVDAPLSTGSGEWFLWEFPIAYWMEAEGYDVTYTSNLDTHADPENLLRAKGFLSVGHDEYYTMAMYHQLKQAIARGLNVAFLSGNTCCGRIELHPAQSGRRHRAFERVDVFGPPDPEDLERLPDMRQLRHTSPNANRLIGARTVAPITGGADWTCVKPDHWLFEGTGMQYGEAIPGLVGWEFHGDPATIEGLEIVATGPTQSNPGEPNGGTYVATVYPGPQGNIVFNASTCWWGDSLSEPPGYVRPKVYTAPRGPDPRARQITRNLLDRIRASRFPGLLSQ